MVGPTRRMGPWNQGKGCDHSIWSATSCGPIPSYSSLDVDITLLKNARITLLFARIGESSWISQFSWFTNTTVAVATVTSIDHDSLQLIDQYCRRFTINNRMPTAACFPSYNWTSFIKWRQPTRVLCVNWGRLSLGYRLVSTSKTNFILQMLHSGMIIHSD